MLTEDAITCGCEASPFLVIKQERRAEEKREKKARKREDRLKRKEEERKEKEKEVRSGACVCAAALSVPF